MFDHDYRLHVPPHLRAAMDRLPDPYAVWDIFRDAATLAEMERLTALKRPAVCAASAKLLALGNSVRQNDAKKTFGKIARFFMEELGYVIDRKGVETPDDPLFTKATRYRMRSVSPRKSAATVLTPPEIPDVSTSILDRLLRALSSAELQYFAEAARAELTRR